MSNHPPPLLWGANRRKAKFSERFVVQTIREECPNGRTCGFPERFVVQGTSLNTQSFREFEKSGKTRLNAESLSDKSFRLSGYGLLIEVGHGRLCVRRFSWPITPGER